MNTSKIKFCLRCEDPFEQDEYEFCPECRGKMMEEERREE